MIEFKTLNDEWTRTVLSVVVQCSAVQCSYSWPYIEIIAAEIIKNNSKKVCFVKKDTGYFKLNGYHYYCYFYDHLQRGC